MKLAELQKKIADVLGVSVSQKELSFEIFVDKISEILLEHITLKVQRVGYFQLKVVSAKNGIRPLIFSPLPEDFSRDSRNLYLTIEVAPKIKNTPEFDSNIFSIGVGKPLLPLSIDELPDTETSYAMLKKSIEERVKELLMESDQIPNFNIWDDYYKSPEEYEEESVEGTKTQLFELTSDLEFKEEMIPDKIPENISDNFNLSSSGSDHTSQLDYSNLFNEENKPKEETENYDDLLIAREGESDLDSGDVLLPPEENADLENTIEITSEEEDYSALKDLQLNEISDDTITISDLLDDKTPSLRNNRSVKPEVNEIEESIVPIEEVLPRMLADEKVEDDKDKIEISRNYMPGHKKSLFEELHNLSNEVKSSEEKEEDIFEETQIDEEEKIEWNWGDELREEFGLPVVERDDAKYEMIKNHDAEKEGDLELVDDFLEDEKITKDLFSQLEKTLEREFNYEEEPKHRLTIEDKKPTIERNKLKKVIMEFSGPPAKYEFIEDRKSEKERRMAISLVDEGDVKIKKNLSYTDEEIREQSKDSYFGKMFLIIFGAFIIVAAVVVFIILNGNNKKQVREESKPIEQGQTSAASDSENAGTLTQSIPNTKDSAALAYDELSDFPRTATPPVPIKDATDKQILETIKNETAKLQSSKKENEKPAVKQSNAKPENSGLNKTVTTDTKVSNRVFYDGKNYFLQVSSWTNRIRAGEEVNRLRALGFNAFIIEANLPQKGGIWYRVRVGPFKTEKETEEFLKKNNL